jgi:hypothetical protein
MARGVTLSTLVEQLRAEIGASTSVSQGAASVPHLQQVLRRTQDRLYVEFNWPHLVIERDEPIIAGERYYTYNSDINFDRIISAYVKNNTTWEPVLYGFDSMIYNISDTELNETSEPVSRYRNYEDNQFEVWPVPSDNTQVIRFCAIRALRPLIANDDVCDLDSNLLVLYSASELLQRLKSADAESKLAAASQLYRNLRGNYDKTPTFIMGGGLLKQRSEGINLMFGKRI